MAFPSEAQGSGDLFQWLELKFASHPFNNSSTLHTVGMWGGIRFGKMTKFWAGWGDGCTTMRVRFMPLSYPCKNG